MALPVFDDIPRPRPQNLLVLIVLLLAWLTPGSAAAVELTLVHFVATNHPMHAEVFIPLAAHLAAASGGDLTLKIIPGLSDPARQLQRVTNHEADMVFGLPGYTPDHFPRTRLIELPAAAERPAQATRMLANALPGALAPDFADVVPLGLWVNEPAVLLSRERSIRNLDDLAGLRVRAADDISARVLSLWGATAVMMPVNEIAQAIRDARIDAALIGSSGIVPFQLYTLTRSCTVGLPPLFTSFYLLMNRDAWASLPAASQGLLRDATGLSLSQGATLAYERAGQAGLQKLRDTNVEVIELPSATAALFDSALRPVTPETLAALAQRGIDGQQVLDAFRPRLAGLGNGAEFQVLLHGGEGITYELWTSADLQTWMPVGRQPGNAAGEAVWTFSPQQRGFFRAEIP